VEPSTILVIEDDLGIAHVMQAIFAINKINAVFASTGKKGLELLQEGSFDLILCDIMLPDMLGYDILKRVKADWQLHRIPFIFLTAFANPEDIRLGMNEGADDYITKPFSAQQLITAIQSRLSLRTKQKQLDIQLVNERWLMLMNEHFQHEFMTPLNGIIQSATLMKSGCAAPSADELAQLAAAIESSGRRMMRNIRKLTLFTVAGSGKNMLSGLNRSEPVLGIAEQCRLNVSKEHPGLTITIDKRPSSELRIDTYAPYLQYILSELLDNAIRHGGGTVPVFSIEVLQNKRLQFCVTNRVNSPIEFTEADVAPFKKFHVDRDMNGLGIGLYVAVSLAKILNWSLTIRITENLCNTLLEGPLEQTDFVYAQETGYSNH
jgi:DNA-binding response OmpR family regulator